MTDQFAAKIGGRRHTGLDEGLATAFIRGACAPLCIKRQNGRRRRRAQLNQAKSQRVHVHEAPNEPEALRSGLVRQTDSDGVTFASLSGNSRQLY